MMLSTGIDLEQPSREIHREDNIADVNINMAITRDDTCTMNPPKVSSTNEVSTGPNVNALKNLEPHDGMEFESKEEAFTFYKEYARSVGFSAIIKASRRSRVSGNFIDAKFVCTRYGIKPETNTAEMTEPILDNFTEAIPITKKRGRINQSWSKTDCKACMHVKRSQDGRWIIRSFVKDHNHEIFPDQAYYFRGHRNINLGNSNVDAFHAIRARNKKLFVTMSRHSGSVKKVENQKSTSANQIGNRKILGLDEGDSQVMLEQFLCMQEENPNFFYAIDLNEEQRLRNVFWVDAKGRLDYENFDDVIFFDTMYIKNEYKLPFTPFIGVNHHSQFLFLGCGLIGDDSKASYVWLMKAWVRAMGGQAPKVILTDQDKALKEAVNEVFPDSGHCFCLWHVLGKIPEKLSYVLRKHENFMMKFNKCIKSWTDDEFEKRWWKMIDRFDLRNDMWLQSLYEDRERWMPHYTRDVFFAGMSTNQRSDSINAFFDKYMQRKTTLKEFLDQYKSILRDKYEEEAKADFETWHKQPGLKSPSPFGKQMATVYTHAIFKKFQFEVLGVVACHPKIESENGSVKTFKVQDFEENQDFTVTWNELLSDISCSCHSFEFNGFLCRHVMIVLQMAGVHSIPSRYILKRWTKDAKSREVTRVGPTMVETRAQRYNDICRRAFKLGDEGSLSQESYNLAFNALEEALRKCECVNNSMPSVIEPNSPSNQGLHEFGELNDDNGTSKANKMDGVFIKGKGHAEPEVISMVMHDSWQQMGRSNLRAPTLDCSYGTQESMQRVDQLSTRHPALEGYYATQQLVQGMGQLNSLAATRDDYFDNQPSMQGLGQLHSIAPIHDGRFVNQQRIHGLGSLHFRPEPIQSSFDIQDSMQDMAQPDVGPSMHRMALKHIHSKHLSH